MLSQSEEERVVMTIAEWLSYWTHYGSRYDVPVVMWTRIDEFERYAEMWEGRPFFGTAFAAAGGFRYVVVV